MPLLSALLVGALAPAVAEAQQPKPPATATPAAPPAKPAPPAPPPPAPPPPATAAPAQPAPVAPAQPVPAPPPPAAAPAAPAQPSPPAEPLIVPPTSAAPTAPPAVAADPDRDAKRLVEQGKERPTGSAEIGARPSEVYAEDWWSHARPTFEFHGYFRVRAELFHNFALGRRDAPLTALWPQPPDNSYTEARGNRHLTSFCGSDPAPQAPATYEDCENNTQAGANLRFRLNPELHISDNLRVLSQIDLLDNLVLGSTPEGYANVPRTGGGGYEVVPRGGYAPTSAFAATQWAPSAGQNSLSDSIVVKRVWGEYLTPVGLLRFGRMPSHWGLGMLANSGDGHDQDYSSTADRIMLVTGIKKYDIYFAGAWDFANEGPISASLTERQGQSYDAAQYDDVSQYVFVAVRRRNPELQRLELARGDVVLNGGLYLVFRNQFLANDSTGTPGDASLGKPTGDLQQGYLRRGAEAWIPDLWFQLLYDKFRFEAELAMIWGSIENTDRVPGSTNYANRDEPGNDGWNIRQFGMATQTEFRAIEDRLRIQFGFGYASGDPDVDSLAPPSGGLQPQLTADRTFSTFRFHPGYNIDLILWRNILSRVQGAYYFRPSVDYDFARDKNGQRLGGGAAIVWSRASEFVQTPGHQRDLGLELDFQLYFQSKDGTLNDDPDKMGGFYTSLQYGVMFPLGGLGYLEGEQQEFENNNFERVDTETAQTLRWYIGVLF